MKTAAMVALAAVMGATAGAGSVEARAGRKVTVCFDKGNIDEIADHSETIASKMFRDIGVKLEWHSDGRFCEARRDQVIAVSLSTHTPQNLLPGALAYALPFEGVHIEVFYDRMSNASEHLVPHILAHALVHEITHILQGVNVHSANGIMKAHWERDDYSHMDTKPLTFTKVDIELIYKGLDARASYPAPGTLVAANPVSHSATAQCELQ